MDLDEPEICGVFFNQAEGYLAKAMLEGEGIMVVIASDSLAHIYPIGPTSFGGMKLMVRRRDLPRALDILNSLHLDGE